METIIKHPTLTEVIRLAVNLHEDQLDKGGAPYIYHLARVADRVRRWDWCDDRHQMVAWLHDSIEDVWFYDKDGDNGCGESRPLLPSDLLAKGLSQEIVDAVVAITHLKDEPLTAYWPRVKANELAFHVKIADMMDNSDPDRGVEDPTDRERMLKKYARGLSYMLGPWVVVEDMDKVPVSDLKIRRTLKAINPNLLKYI